jgi:hypothetical protein
LAKLVVFFATSVASDKKENPATATQKQDIPVMSLQSTKEMILYNT